MILCVLIVAILITQRFQCKGQIAIITGSRLKIGYHITLILRGATVIATTRFPVDSALRFLRRKTL
jgi:hypothetical protein